MKRVIQSHQTTISLRKILRFLLLLPALYSGLALSLQSAEVPESGLLDYFDFNTPREIDALGNGILDLKNVTFENGTIFLNGEYERSYDENGNGSGYRAVAKLFRRWKYESFTVALDFFQLSSSTRGQKNILTGGESHRWMSLFNDEGHLALSLNNGESTHVFANGPLKADRWQRLVCAVDLNEGIIHTYLNGVKLDDIQLAPDFQWNVIGTSREIRDKSFTFTNYSSGQVLYGYADNLMIFDHALSSEEVAPLLSADDLEEVANAMLAPAPEERAIELTTGFYVAWPANAEGYVLEKAESVGGPWVRHEGALSVVEGQNVVVMNLESRMKFYRMTKAN